MASPPRDPRLLSDAPPTGVASRRRATLSAGGDTQELPATAVSPPPLTGAALDEPLPGGDTQELPTVAVPLPPLTGAALDEPIPAGDTQEIPAAPPTGAAISHPCDATEILTLPDGETEEIPSSRESLGSGTDMSENDAGNRELDNLLVSALGEPVPSDEQESQLAGSDPIDAVFDEFASRPRRDSGAAERAEAERVAAERAAAERAEAERAEAEREEVPELLAKPPDSTAYFRTQKAGGEMVYDLLRNDVDDEGNLQKAPPRSLLGRDRLDPWYIKNPSGPEAASFEDVQVLIERSVAGLDADLMSLDCALKEIEKCLLERWRTNDRTLESKVSDFATLVSSNPSVDAIKGRAYKTIVLDFSRVEIDANRQIVENGLASAGVQLSLQEQLAADSVKVEGTKIEVVMPRWIDAARAVLRCSERWNGTAGGFGAAWRIACPSLKIENLWFVCVSEVPQPIPAPTEPARGRKRTRPAPSSEA